jgi:hypothetical protein
MAHTLQNGTANLSDRQRRIFSFLHDHPVGVLSTVTPDNNPHGVVVYFAVDPDFSVHILTKTNTHKYDNMIHNDHVMLTVFEPQSQTTVQVIGVATEQRNTTAINTTIQGVAAANTRMSTSLLPPIVKLQAGMFTSFRIEPMQIRMATYARVEVDEQNELFESLESFDIERRAA